MVFRGESDNETSTRTSATEEETDLDHGTCEQVKNGPSYVCTCIIWFMLSWMVVFMIRTSFALAVWNMKIMNEIMSVQIYTWGPYPTYWKWYIYTLQINRMQIIGAFGLRHLTIQTCDFIQSFGRSTVQNPECGLLPDILCVVLFNVESVLIFTLQGLIFFEYLLINIYLIFHST